MLPAQKPGRQSVGMPCIWSRLTRTLYRTLHEKIGIASQLRTPEPITTNARTNDSLSEDNHL
jgi:hypothetical protein